MLRTQPDAKANTRSAVQTLFYIANSRVAAGSRVAATGGRPTGTKLQAALPEIHATPVPSASHGVAAASGIGSAEPSSILSLYFPFSPNCHWKRSMIF